MRVLALVVFCALGCTTAFAEELSGRVDALYVEAANGVLLEERFAGARPGARWADVSVGDRRVLARVPEEMRIRRGDRIAVRVGTPKSNPLAYVLPTTTVSRALAPDPNASVGR